MKFNAMTHSIQWSTIHTVFLDMDGTLLDLKFDNHFWLSHLPKCYAQHYHLSFEEAKVILLNRYQEMSGKLEWYCVDYWSHQLGLDVGKLKEDVAHLISIHPYVMEFLAFLRNNQKRVVLVTNAHHKSLSLKMQRTHLTPHFDQVVCAHELGLPKEHLGFWDTLQKIIPFHPHHTLLIDDSLSVLRSAAHYGIAHLLSIRQPDSQLPPKDSEEFQAIHYFQEIMSNSCYSESNEVGWVDD